MPFVQGLVHLTEDMVGLELHTRRINQNFVNKMFLVHTSLKDRLNMKDQEELVVL